MMNPAEGEKLSATVFGRSASTEQFFVFRVKRCEVLDVLITKKQIKAIGLGVPGIVEGGSFWKQDKDSLTFQ